jgi:hypothetical protein
MRHGRARGNARGRHLAAPPAVGWHRPQSSVARILTVQEGRQLWLRREIRPGSGPRSSTTGSDCFLAARSDALPCPVKSANTSLALVKASG